MIAPDRIAEAGKRRERQNMCFRSWLKSHVDEEKLDADFLALHKELFAGYDCAACRNCCRAFTVPVRDEELSAVAAAVEMTPEAFREAYLSPDDDLMVMPAPCPLLKEDGGCRAAACKPEDCRGFPFTDRPDRMGSLWGIVGFASVCPVVYEMLERLKDMYRFR